MEKENMENYEEDYDLNLSPSNKYGDDDDDDTPTGGFKSSQNKSSKTPALDTYSRDLTAMAARGELDPIIGRDHEIERVSQILCRI
jgi:ATP-dependent Clp protease ATP-binding subunit ClpA